MTILGLVRVFVNFFCVYKNSRISFTPDLSVSVHYLILVAAAGVAIQYT